MREMRNAYRILVGIPQENRQLERPRCRWEDNITIDIKATRQKIVNWNNPTHDRVQWQPLVKTVLKRRFP
jgi:hypothetical protein